MKISKHSQQCNRYLFRTYNSISIQTMRPPIYRLSFSLKYLLLLICVTFRQIKTTYFTHFFFLLFFSGETDFGEHGVWSKNGYWKRIRKVRIFWFCKSWYGVYEFWFLVFWISLDYFFFVYDEMWMKLCSEELES